MVAGSRFVFCMICIAKLMLDHQTEATAIDNGVVGEPTITCGSDEISIWINTQKAFNGKIYVKGEYGKPECSNGGGGEVVNGSTPLEPGKQTTASTRPSECTPCPVCENPSTNSFLLRDSAQSGSRHSRQLNTEKNGAHLKLAMGTCNMKRERSLNPQGVTLSVAIVISFHPIFITKVDKAYQVRCFYMEADKTVTSVLDVSMPQTTELAGQAIMPICQYTIHRGSLDGPELRFAKVGDPVFHKWECKTDSPDMFGILVHTCTVDDGQGKQIQVLNDRGCTLDKFVIGDLSYHSSLLSATVESHVFKFADRSSLDFQCAITICLKPQNGCEGISPPRCEKFSKRQALHVKNNSDLNLASSDWSLHARRLSVVDIDDNVQPSELELLEQNSWPTSERLSPSSDNDSNKLSKSRINNSDQNLCLSVLGFGVLISLCTFVFTAATIVLGSLFVFRSRKML